MPENCLEKEIADSIRARKNKYFQTKAGYMPASSSCLLLIDIYPCNQDGAGSYRPFFPVNFVLQIRSSFI